MYFLFFFQAEDGIRYGTVTGVQTCALPISFLSVSEKAWARAESAKLPKFYFNLKKERKNAASGESSWTPATSLLLALAEALKYIKMLGMAKLVENAQML